MPQLEETRKVFIKDILDHPEDDAPRLIFADWLDDHDNHADQAHAEFIRAQIEINRLRNGPSESEQKARLTNRINALEKQYGHDWMAPFTGKNTAEGQGRFTRGFYDHISIDADAFLDKAPDIFHHVPAIDFHIMLRHEDELKRLSESAYLNNLRRLSIAGEGLNGNDIIRAIADSTQTKRLEELILAYNICFRSIHGSTNPLSSSMRNLGGSTLMSQLKELDLSANYIGAEGTQNFVAGLAKRGQPSSIKKLILTNCGIGNDGFLALARCPQLASLQELEVYNNEIDPDQLQVLADKSLLPKLKSIRLGDYPNWPERPCNTRSLQILANQRNIDIHYNYDYIYSNRRSSAAVHSR